MLKLVMRNLLLSSLLLLTGCAPEIYSELKNQNPEQHCIDTLLTDTKTVFYNTQINVVGKHMSGILIIKTTGENITRTVFTSETGVTFFDFEFNNDQFKVKYCISKLNKKAVINTLKTDLGLLIRYKMKHNEYLTKTDGTNLYFGFKQQKVTNWYIVKQDCSELIRIENNSRSKQKIIVNLSTKGNELPASVYIEHQAFNFNISLNKIDR